MLKRVLLKLSGEALMGDQGYGIEAGKVAWTKRLGDCDGSSKPGPEGARCDVDGGPTVAPDGSIFVGADGLYKLDASGEVSWQWPPDEEKRQHVFAAPLVEQRFIIKQFQLRRRTTLKKIYYPFCFGRKMR